MVSERLVAVYPSSERARAAARAAIAVEGVAPPEIRVGDRMDRLAAVEGEMHEEMAHTLAGPGNVGPFTKEMTKGMLLGVVVGGAIGTLFALPFAAIGFGGWDVWLRLLVVAIAGALVGMTAGWVIGGAFAAKRPEEPLAAEEGTTVTAPARVDVEKALRAAGPVRIDLVDAEGHPLRTLPTDEPDHPGIVEEIGRHMREEDHRG